MIGFGFTGIEERQSKANHRREKLMSVNLWEAMKRCISQPAARRGHLSMPGDRYRRRRLAQRSGSERTLAFEGLEGRLLLANGNVVVLDPGHGINATKVGGTGDVTRNTEAFLVLEIAKALREELQDKGFQVHLTRENEIAPTSDRKRAEVAQQHNADFFLSLHFNGAGDKTVRGTEAYISNVRDYNYQDDKDFANEMVQSTLNSMTQGKARRPPVKNSGLHAIRDAYLGNTSLSQPVIAAYLEIDFLSNDDVDRAFSLPSKRQLLVENLADGFVRSRASVHGPPDNILPTVVHAAANKSSVPQGGDITFSWRAVDNQAIDHISLLLYQGSNKVNTGSLYGVPDGDRDGRIEESAENIPTTGAGSKTWRVFDNLTPGNYRIKVVAWDTADNPSSGNRFKWIDFTVTPKTTSQPLISVYDATITEGNFGLPDADFTVSLSASSSQTVAVDYYTQESTAKAGYDFYDRSGTLTFAPYQTTKTISIPIRGDYLVERDEWFYVKLKSPVNAKLGDASARGVIDNDDHTTVSVSDVTVTEGDSGTTQARVEVRLSSRSDETVRVNVATKDGTAKDGFDYYATGGPLVFSPGETLKTLAIDIIGDTSDEMDELLYVQLTNPENVTVVRGSATVKIRDDDDLPLVQINDVTVDEGDSGTRNAVLTIGLSQSSTDTVSVYAATVDGTAKDGFDYYATGGPIVFSPGQTTRQFNVQVLGDMADEANEIFWVHLTNPENALVADGRGKATIRDDDVPALPEVSVTDATVTEGDSGTRSATFNVRLSAPSSLPVSLQYATSNGTAVAGNDFSAASGTLAFSPNETHKTVSVPVIGDTDDEPNEIFWVHLANPSNATISDGAGKATIYDDDELTVGISDRGILEGDSGTRMLSFPVYLSAQSTQPVTVDYETSTWGTATAGEDYVAANGTLTFDPGQTSKMVDIVINSDTIEEPDETLRVNLKNAHNVTIVGSYANAVIYDDDESPLPRISIDDVSATERQSGSYDFEYTVTLSESPTGPVYVDYASSDDLAEAPTDYTAVSGTLAFAVGQTTATISVPVHGDTTPESDETFFVNLSDPQGGLLADETGKGMIVNDDLQLPLLFIAHTNVEEGDAGENAATFVLTLSAVGSQAVIVDYTTLNEGSATAGEDYQPTSGSVTIPVGQTTASLPVDVFGDTMLEADEVFFVELSNPSGAVIAKDTARGTIENDDQLLPSITVRDITVAEGDQGTSIAHFAVELSSVAALPVQVEYVTADGSAQAGLDYGVTEGKLLFQPHQTQKTIAVQVFGDTVSEGDELFSLQLSNPVNARLATQTAVATIRDDDTATSSVSGWVRYDTQATGLVDPASNVIAASRPGVADMTVYLDTNDDGDLDAGEPSTTTDDEGHYEFVELPPQTTVIRLALPDGWVQTSPNPAGTRRLTENDNSDLYAQPGDGWVAWREQTADGSHFWLNDGVVSTRLTDVPLMVHGGPVVEGGQVVYSAVSGTNYEIFVRENGASLQLTNTGLPSTRPQIDRGQVVWHGWDDDHDYQIYFYDGESIQQLTSNSEDDTNPQLDSGQIVWVWRRHEDSEIMFFDGATVQRLTNNSYADGGPQIDHGQVVWAGFDGNDSEIFFFDGNTVHQLTDNDYDDGNARISDGWIVWTGFGGDPEVFLYDGVSVRQVTNNTTSDTDVHIDHGFVVWKGWDGADWEIFGYDGTTTKNLSNNDVEDTMPRIAGNQVVWGSRIDGDYEIVELSRGDSHVVHLEAGDVRTDLNFAAYRPVSIVGREFNDLNGDGVFDIGESGIGDVTIELDLHADGTIDDLRVTDDDGAYAFERIPPGTHTVRLQPSPNSVVTTWKEVTIVTTEPTGAADGSYLDVFDVPFGSFTPVVVQGSVFNDANGSGGVDPGELGLPGWRVEIDYDDDESVDEATTSAADGLYTFLDVGPGNHRVTAIAPAGWAWSSPADGMLVVSPVSGEAAMNTDFGAHAAPLLDPIGNQSADEQALLSFTATATDQDRPADSLTFSLDGAAIALGMSITSAGAFAWTPTELQGGASYDATITVTDDGTPNLDDSETISITVAEVNVAPLLDPIGNQSADEQALLSFTATATDQDRPADSLTFSLDGAAIALGMSITSAGAFAWTPTELQGGASYDATITVTDDGTPNLDDSETISITVAEVNVAPLLDPIGNQSADEQALLSFTATATDQDRPADSLTFSLDGAAIALGMSITSAGAFAWTPTELQGGASYDATITVTDDGTPNLDDSETISITVAEVNVAPLLDPIGNQSADEQALLSFTATATDQDRPADSLTFSLDGAAIALGMSITSAGAFAWTPTELQGGASYDATITVTDDGTPNLDHSETISITVAEVNVAPVLDPIGNQSAGEQAELSFTATATDQDRPADSLTFSLDGAAIALGMSITSAGAFAWTPTELQGGASYDATITVTDDGTPNLDDSETISITVAEVNVAPLLDPIGNQSADEQALLSFTATATDQDRPADSLTFSLDGAAIALGMSITSAGAFAWTPTELQGGASYDATITVTDDGTPNLDDSETISITVAEVNVAPLLDPIGNQSADEQALLSFTATATDQDRPADSLTFSLDGAAIALGMSITSAGAFAWTPTELQGGASYDATITVTDDGTPNLDDSETISITVAEVNVAPLLDPIGNQSADEQALLSFTATATDQDRPADSLTFSLDGAAIALGMSITSAGAFAWTPTELQGGASYDATITVTDDGTPNLDDSETISITVAEVNVAPLLDPIGNQSADEQALLSFTATATDQDRPADSLTFSLDGAAIALGMSITSAGAFAWTPTELQGGASYDATITVTDDGTPNLDDSETISITVAEVNVAPLLDPIGNQSADEQALLSFTATATDQDRPADSLTFSLDGAAIALGMSITSAGAFAWTPTELQGGASYDATITVTDDGTPNLDDSETISITVAEVNVAPLLDPIGNQSADEQALLSFTATATDQDRPADSLTFSLDGAAIALGMSITSAGAFAWTPTELQGGASYDATITVTDDGTPNLDHSETISITVAEVNVAPVLDPIGNQSAGEQALLSFTATATDQDRPADSLTFSLDGAAIALGMSITSAGAFAWTPTELQGGASYDATITVTDDGTPNLDHSETISITVAEVNVAPVLDPIGNQSAGEQAELSFTATATDQDRPADSLTFSLDGAAIALGMSITSAGAFAWTPTELQGGASYDATITVTDDGTPNLDDSETISITVAEVNVAPLLDPIGNQSADEQALLSFTATATDQDRPADSLTFSLDGAAIALGMSITSAGAFAWTPTELQGGASYDATITVTDDGTPNLDDSETISITVAEVNVAPLLDPIGNQSADEQALLSFTATATDQDRPADSLTFSLDGAAIALGMSITSAGAFAWTPTELQGGASYDATITVTDDGTPNLDDSETISITVAEVNVAPLLDPIGNQSADEQALLSFTATATDQDRPADSLTFSLDGAAIALGMSITSAGAFAWTLYRIARRCILRCDDHCDRRRHAEPG